MNIFFTFLYQPIYNLLVLFYDILPFNDLGVAIILLTILIKGLLFPLTFKTLKVQRDMQAIQPKIAAIREQYKNDKEQQARELMKIYQENNVNPLASCLPLLIQLPIFIALFRVLQAGLHTVNGDILYGFIPNPGTMNIMFAGIIDLTAISVPLAILAAIAQYLQVKRTAMQKPAPEVAGKPGTKDEELAANMNKTMMYFMPLLTLMIGTTSLPAGVMLYWLTTTILTIILYAVFLPVKKTATQEE
ncbi:protein translocase component YidC [Candidatus Parcubacteria bacterium]|nr:MAG: protein translocase component YidC [Candidatus Parcubacteria bacterium]